MVRAIAATVPPIAQPELSRFLNPALFRLRWIVLAALFGLAVLDPTTGWAGVPNWALLLLFAGYNGLLGLADAPLGPRTRHLRAGLDLIGAAIIYLLGADPNGPLSALMLLAVVCAAATLSLHSSVIYTLLALLLTASIAPTLPLWSAGTLRDLGTQMLVLGLTGIGTAVLTRRLALEGALARAAQDEAARNAELNQVRAAFIATVSHDLRTPFTAMRAGLGLAETSLDDRLRPDERLLLDNVRRNTNRLDILINDLLAFNQYEAGVLLIERQPLDLRAVIAESIATVHPLLHEKGQRLEVDLPESLLHAGDARRLEQMVVNLLDNAHRYTPPGACIAIAGHTTPATIHLTITDEGPGIPAAEHEAVFQRFHRIATTEGGSGLGLAIVRAMVEIHGGRVWVESVPGAGAVFHVVLPRYQEEEGGSR